MALRLREMQSRGISPNTLKVHRQGRTAYIHFGSTVLLTVTPKKARANQSLPLDLARLWAHRLTGLLGTPALTVSANAWSSRWGDAPDHLQRAVGGTRCRGGRR